ncbi:hypothetical protein BDW74DRAFT_149231 [Aspergillus multicolor]|uniref:uncharacterized protein n=1 Tax=Aspergillus multicolor TaxID=41759 RepID=UPI003CCE3FA4
MVGVICAWPALQMTPTIAFSELYEQLQKRRRHCATTPGIQMRFILRGHDRKMRPRSRSESISLRRVGGKSLFHPPRMKQMGVSRGRRDSVPGAKPNWRDCKHHPG